MDNDFSRQGRFYVKEQVLWTKKLRNLINKDN